MKVLVCGGRDYRDLTRVRQVLDELNAERPITCLVHGAALGADSLAEQWARRRQIKYVGYPAEWDRLKKAAGAIRNKRMLDEEAPDIVVAFPGGPGTANMLAQSERVGFRRRARPDEIVVLAFD